MAEIERRSRRRNVTLLKCLIVARSAGGARQALSTLEPARVRIGDILERVLVSGVSGPIGDALLPYLESQGARITRLVRGPAQGPDQISWDPMRPLTPGAVSGFETVIHLAGETVAG